MRTVKFPLWERIKLIPVELSYGRFYLLVVPAVFILLSGLSRHGYSLDLAFEDGLRATFSLLVVPYRACRYSSLAALDPFQAICAQGVAAGLVLCDCIIVVSHDRYRMD